jgi:hypothetical protein
MTKETELDAQLSRLTADVSADKKLAERLRNQPHSVLKEYGIPVAESAEARELDEGELAGATGGMKWDKNHKSCNVIDARGGSYEVKGVISFTVDANGLISSINGKSTTPCPT